MEYEKIRLKLHAQYRRGLITDGEFHERYAEICEQYDVTPEPQILPERNTEYANSEGSWEPNKSRQIHLGRM